MINSDNASWFSRHPKPLDFEKKKGFGQKNNSFASKAQIFLRNSSSFVELIAQLIKKSDQEDDTEEATKTHDMATTSQQSLTPEMKDCLLAFQSSHPRFLIISIAKDPSFNHDLAEFCQDQSIPCKIESLIKAKYLFNGAGHLNLQGNQALARLMTEAYVENFKGD